MSYESRVYEDGFLDVFKNKAECYLYESHDGEDIIITEDKYDKPLTSASIMDVYNAISDVVLKILMDL